MAINKYRVKEFTPTANQTNMTHSFHAESVVDNVITNQELARKIEARGISRAAEIKAVLEEAANIILEEVAENNRVQLSSSDGVLVSIYPSVSGSISDAQVQAQQDKYPGKTRAEESMLTADMLSWSIRATVGQKFSKQFALRKQAQKVAYSSAQTTADPDGSDTTPDSGSTTPSGGNTQGGDDTLQP